tara:strand:- start:925 stop:2103 length:1179 start_codon:yes stop_codon:yes gene_type:complete
MSEQVKQEGNFKIQKKKPSIKKLAQNADLIKVDLTPKKEEEDAIQEQSTDESVLRAEQPEVGLQEVVEGNEEPTVVAKEVNEEEVTVIQEITEEEVVEEATKLTEEVNEAIENKETTGKQLPENIEKLVSFMEETGGSVEDYVRLNADYSNIDNTALLKEYYKTTRPHLDAEEVSFLIEDAFSWDEDIDDERDIRKKKLAFKEEVAKAKTHLEDLKGKYYEEIKLRPGTTQEQQKAMEFFNRYNEEQNIAQQQHESFKNNTKELFNNDFKGFDFAIGEKKFRYNVQNTNQVAENQSNINNLIKKFLNDKGDVVDTKGYHKAMYAAENVDKIANHFYEQGKADAVKEVVNSSKNIDATPRQSPGDVYIQGLKVRAISGADSSKLKVKTKKFNN